MVPDPDFIIEIGRERDGALFELRALNNRHLLLRQTLAAVKCDDVPDAKTAAALALIGDDALAAETDASTPMRDTLTEGVAGDV